MQSVVHTSVTDATKDAGHQDQVVYGYQAMKRQNESDGDKSRDRMVSLKKAVIVMKVCLATYTTNAMRKV